MIYILNIIHNIICVEYSHFIENKYLGTLFHIILLVNNLLEQFMICIYFNIKNF